MTRLGLLSLLPALLLGCDPKEGEDDTGDDDSGLDGDEGSMPYCDEVEQPLAAEDETPLGITGGAFLEMLPASGTAPVTWTDSTESTASWTLSADSATLRFVESTEVYPEEGGPDIGVYCPDYIAVDGAFTLSTDDGRLAEEMELTFSLDEDSVSAGTIHFGTELDPDGLNGSLDLADFLDPAEYDTIRLFLNGSFVGGEIDATLSAQGEGSDGDTAWATNIDIGFFGDASEIE